ncbi:MAG: hypothetical protein F4Y45_14175 [Acidobacteria bacterium]|nr:hypothetical protein [Acidobacteriota bacterium]
MSGQVILASDVRAFLELGLFAVDTSDPEARESAALSLLIDRRLALDEVERYGPVRPSAARVEENLAAVRAGFADEAAFMRLLAAVGLDLDDLRQMLSDNARLEAYLADRFGASVRLAGPRPAPVADWLAGLARRADIARFDR